MGKRFIKKGDTIILRPAQYDEFIEAVTNSKKKRHRYKEIINALLYTGMRYVELERFHRHPEWFDRRSRSIYLPPEASQKKKRTMRDRYVYLSSQGVVHVENFIEYVDRMPSEDTIKHFLSYISKYIGYPRISVKTFRKTWESWLVISYPNAIPLIAMSQGHTLITAIKHYLNLPFTQEDIREIKIRTAGWSGIEVLGGEK